MLLEASYTSWFEDNLMCTRAVFLRIAGFLREHGVRFAAAKVKQHSFEKKVAAALYFLCSTGGYREVGAAMGMSRSYVMEITAEAVRVLRAVACAVVSFPQDCKGWEAIESGFAARHGYPGIVGANDGSLIEIERPEEFDGFYCRKCYPALNVQAIVSTASVFLSVEVRPGSWSDRKCWQYSAIGQNVYKIIPPGTHFIGDGGYALQPGLLVPYCDREENGELSPTQRKFNFLHSSTRMAVESTFGIWKGRFRMLQGVLGMETPRSAADAVVATIVLHNLMTFFRDSTKIRPFVENNGDDDIFDEEIVSISQRKVAIAKRNANASLICS